MMAGPNQKDEHAMASERDDRTVEETAAGAVAEIGFDPDSLRRKYREERDKRLRPDGNAQYQRVQDRLAHGLDDPYIPRTERAPKTDHVRFAFIGGGFAGLVTCARLVQGPYAVVRRCGGEFEKLLYLSLMGGWEHPLDADGAAALLEEPTPA